MRQSRVLNSDQKQAITSRRWLDCLLAKEPTDADVARLVKHLKKYRERLLTFPHVRGVQLTNTVVE